MTATEILAPRDDLIRGISEVRAEGDGNTMVGYPIVFNTWTTIDSWEGTFLERIHPGAVNKTLKERGDLVKVQFDHGMHPVIGSFPIGKPETMRTDDLGLWTETGLSRATDVQNLIKPRLQEGTIDGMSFRFSVVEESWNEEPGEADHNPRGLPERTIKSLRLFEYGPVTWPAYEATQVGIRGQAAFAAWMQQTPEERADLLRQFQLSPPREIIRIRSGAVVVDTPATDGGTSAVETRSDADPTDEQREAPPTEGHDDAAGTQDADTPAESHESRDDDTPAGGHESSPETDRADPGDESNATPDVAKARKPRLTLDDIRNGAADVARFLTRADADSRD